MEAVRPRRQEQKLERRQAEILPEVDRTRKELERATKKRERIERSWFKVGLAKSKEIELQAEKTFWKVNGEHQDLEGEERRFRDLKKGPHRPDDRPGSPGG